METKDILTKYAYYYEYLQRLGNLVLDSDVTIEHLHLSRGKIQAAYKEIKEYEFNGTIIDYLCWISTLHILNIAHQNVFTKTMSRKYAEYVISNYTSFIPDANNLLRLFIKKPKLFFEWIYSQDKENKIVHKIVLPMEYEDYEVEFFDDVNAYTLLSSFWFILYRENFYYTKGGYEVYYPIIQEPSDLQEIEESCIGIYKPTKDNKFFRLKKD